MKGHGGTLNADYYVNEASHKRSTSTVPTTWYSGKGKTTETIKRPAAVRGGGGGGDERAGPRIFYMTWRWWCMSLHICLSLSNVQHQSEPWDKQWTSGDDTPGRAHPWGNCAAGNGARGVRGRAARGTWVSLRPCHKSETSLKHGICVSKTANYEESDIPY